MEIDYIALAIPVFFLLIAAEWIYSRVSGRALYRLNDAFNNLSCGLLQQLAVLLFATVLVYGYVAIFEHYALFSVDPHSWVSWALCLLGVDFLYYWYHRLAHEINFLWAAHVVHHQSEEYNLAVALRQSALQPFHSMCFYWPLALIGFPPVVFISCGAANTLYQFWIHTQAIDRLGPLENILMTPSHHRVHHGRNPIYIDRNHGGMLILWDKLFGTYQREEEEVAYGVTKPLATWNPLWANVDYWADLFSLARQASCWRDRFLIFVAPPGWRPDELGGREYPEAVAMPPALYDPPSSRSTKIYSALQFAQMLVLVLLITELAKSAGWGEVALVALAIVWGLVGVGAVLDGRSWAGASEWLRLIAMPILIVFLLPESLVGLFLVVCLVNLVAAWTLGVRPNRMATLAGE